MEGLETRDTPAGVVTATVGGGSLILTGDNNAAGNQVRLLEQAIGTFEIQGQSGTLIKLGSAAATTPVTATGVTTDIKATFFDGPDKFSYTGFSSTPLRDVILVMGKGSDKVDFTGTNLNARNVSISQGAGDTGSDETTMGFGNIIIRGSLSTKNGEGSDIVTLEGVQVSGNVTVMNATGGDTTAIQGASYIGGSVTVLNTSGAMGNDTRVKGTTHISKNLSVTNGDKESINQLEGACVVGGNVTFKSGNAGGGTTQNNFQSALIGGSVKATGAGGQNWTNLNNTRVGKSVTIASGPGSASDTLINSFVGGSYTSTKGSASDNLLIDNSTVVGNLTLNFGAATGGTNLFNFDGLTVLGTTTILTAAGDDRVFIDTSAFFGAVRVSAGVGADVVEIGQGAGANTFFYGDLTVALGADADQLRVGVNSAIRVSGNTLYAGILGEMITDSASNVYLGTRKVT